MLNVIATPFGYVIRFFYSFTNNYIIALLLFALAVKIILLPFEYKKRKASMRQQEIKPELDAIKKRYTDLPEDEANQKRQEDMAKLYRDKKANPLSGCLILIVQFPVLLVLYQVISCPLNFLCNFTTDTVTQILNKASEITGTVMTQAQALSLMRTRLGDFTSIPGVLDMYPSAKSIPHMQLFNTDLSNTPTISNVNLLWFIPLLTFVIILASNVVSQKCDNPPSALTKSKTLKIANIIGPLFSTVVTFFFPAIISLYFVFQNIFSIISSVILNKIMPFSAVVTGETKEKDDSRISDDNKDGHSYTETDKEEPQLGKNP
jgi:YidC/Oxa1 family membrane protein insertase